MTDDDLKVFSGNVDQLVGMIQQKTGEAREGIEQFFEQLSADSASAINRTGETVRAYAQQAVETFQETSKHAADSVREGQRRERFQEAVAKC